MANAIPPIILLSLIAMVAVYLLFLRPLLRAAKRKRLRNRPFPPEWESVLETHVPLYHRLPDDLKQQLRGHIQVFVREKNFEGCGGLEMNDTIRVCIAAQACILLLNRKTNYYPKLVSILIYPCAYEVEEEVVEDFFTTELTESRLGESWDFGTVVLAWDHARHTAGDVRSGQNLVLHEFAHQLDHEDGVTDGAPLLDGRASYAAWARVLGKEYRKLRRAVRHHRRHVLDPYGAEDPAEFFAVATETFFQRPEQLKQMNEELYDALKAYYRVDPYEWT